MRVELLFPSKYLRAADFGGKPVTKTIAKVRIDELQTTQGKEKKPVVYFSDTPKLWCLNKTCAKQIAEKLGNETNDWAGHKVTLYATKCDAFGKVADCIRVKDCPDAGLKVAAPEPYMNPDTGEIATAPDPVAKQ